MCKTRLNIIFLKCRVQQMGKCLCVYLLFVLICSLKISKLDNTYFDSLHSPRILVNCTINASSPVQVNQDSSIWTSPPQSCIYANSGVDVALDIRRRSSVLSRNHSFFCQHDDRQYCMEYFLPRNEVTAYAYDFPHTYAQPCQKNVHMILMINSHFSYVTKRQAIRDTWGGAVAVGRWPVGGDRSILINVTTKVVFVLGLSLDTNVNRMILEENNKYNDVIQGNFIDSYLNMTLKSLLALKWVITHCPCALYLIKSDDDMLINFPYLVRIISDNPFRWGIMGPNNQGSKTYRKGKWGLTMTEYPFKYYPSYESGSAYVISIDLIQPLFSLAQYMPHIFVDDVYITGILGYILNATHVLHHGFAYAVTKRASACDVIHNKIITSTKENPMALRALWDDIIKGVTCSGSTDKIERSKKLPLKNS